MDFKAAKDQYYEAKQMMEEAQVTMKYIVDNFDGSLQEAIDLGMVKYNFPAPPQSLRTYDMEQSLRRIGRI